MRTYAIAFTAIATTLVVALVAYIFAKQHSPHLSGSTLTADERDELLYLRSLQDAQGTTSTTNTQSSEDPPANAAPAHATERNQTETSPKQSPTQATQNALSPVASNTLQQSQTNDRAPDSEKSFQDFIYFYRVELEERGTLIRIQSVQEQ